MDHLPPPSARDQENPPPPANGIPQSPVPEAIRARFLTPAKRLKVSESKAAELFDFTVDPFTYHAIDLPGTSKAERTRNGALLLAMKSYLTSGAWTADWKEFRADCINHGCWASAFRRHLAPFKTSFMDDIVVPLMKHEGSPSQAAARQVESLFAGLLGPEEQTYVSEAARCSAVKCYRAAIVMLWAAAVARLHGDIQRVGFIAYNQAAAGSVKKTGQPFNRISKSINITSLADLQLGRDFDLIAVGIELWNYDIQTFEELNRCLNTRNSAAHPGSFEPTSLDVHQFAEKLKRHLFAVVGVFSPSS